MRFPRHRKVWRWKESRRKSGSSSRENRRHHSSHCCVRYLALLQPCETTSWREGCGSTRNDFVTGVRGRRSHGEVEKGMMTVADTKTTLALPRAGDDVDEGAEERDEAEEAYPYDEVVEVGRRVEVEHRRQEVEHRTAKARSNREVEGSRTLASEEGEEERERAHSLRQSRRRWRDRH